MPEPPDATPPVGRPVVLWFGAMRPNKGMDLLAAAIERKKCDGVADALREAGWTVLRFWEHENPTEVVLAIERELSLTE